MYSVKRSFVELHIAVFLFGFTAILGELIELHPLILTWWRVVLASAFFLVLPSMMRNVRSISKSLIRIYFGIGLLVALHWLTFYAAIKASNASITLVCLATTTFFTALIEPAVMKTRVSKLQLGLGLAILPGMILIVNSTGGQYIWGIVLGIMSAVLAASFGALNKRYLGGQDPMSVTLIEMVAATVLLTVGLPFVLYHDAGSGLWPGKMDWIYLILLALICTNVAYLLALRALRHLSAYMTALTVNLEPLYGIILAAVLLAQYQELNMRFYYGAAIILIAVIGYPMISRKLKSSTRE